MSSKNWEGEKEKGDIHTGKGALVKGGVCHITETQQQTILESWCLKINAS